jgi:hypothetical protein
MSMRKPNPCYNVVSLRVSDEDLRAIKSLLAREQITISELMRDALQVVRKRLEPREALPKDHAPYKHPLRRRLN